MNVRGVIEGFYGPPWTHEERLDLMRFCGAHGFNTWVHAPKDDPFHRARWREPYPDDELDRLAELVREAGRNGVDFAYAIAPGLDVCYSRGSDLDVLVTKVEQVRGIGVRNFQLLWDDLGRTFHCPEDEERFGGEESPLGAAQAELSNRVAEAVEQPGPLVVCPLAYAGTGDGPYRRSFAPRLDSSVVVYYPVNDFAPETLHLGPLRGRDPRLAGGRLRGIVANAMLQAVPSKLALATVAEWALDPWSFDPVASFERALAAHGAEVLEAVRHLAPPGASNNLVLDVPGDVAGLVDALAPGVDAASGASLLESFV